MIRRLPGDAEINPRFPHLPIFNRNSKNQKHKQDASNG